MNKVLFRFVLVACCLGNFLLRAAPNPPDTEHPPATARELAQGFRDRVILARPLPNRGAAADLAEAAHGLRTREQFARFRDLRIIELPEGDTAEAAIERLQATGHYEFVAPDYMRQIAVEPNETAFTNGSLWGLKNTGASNGIVGADIKAVEAWALRTDAANVVVAVIDTGVNLAHEDIAPNLWRNPNPTFGDINGARFLNGGTSNNPQDDNGHGTHVAGTIGAVGNNGVGIAGVAWRVQIMAVKVFPGTGNGFTSDIVRGVNYAIQNGAHIINASYGGLVAGGFDPSELAAITAARDAGVIYVAAAGNSAANLDVARRYPASHALDNIVTVGNSTRRDELALSSNFGSVVDLFAPGSEIVSLSHSSNTGTTTLSGTSMAAPHVAGALALLKAAYPQETYRQLINRLLRGVDRVDRFTGRAQTGGRLNVFKALTASETTPFNDRFAERARLTGNNLYVRASTTGATAEPGEPAHAGETANTSVWWEWTPSVTGTVSVSTTGSGYNTVLAVYSAATATPESPASLSLVAANDDDPSALVITSRLSFNAVAGSTYYLTVSGKRGEGGMTILNVGTTPANDSFASANVVSGQSLRVTGYNANCSREPGEPTIYTYGANSLWYRWTAPRSGRFQVSAVSDDFDPVAGVFTGSAVNALTYIAENDNANFSSVHTGSLCTFNAVAGTTYHLMVGSKSAFSTGAFTLTLVDSIAQAITGDNVTGSASVGLDGTLFIGSTDRSVYAFAPDGTQKWKVTTGGIIDTCSPTIALDGTVYIGSNDGILYALNPATGAEKWRRSFGTASPASNSPALAADGTIYIKPGDGYLHALNPANGTTKWRFNVNGPTSYASPAVARDGTIYQGSEDKKLYALAPDGSLKWSFSHPESNEIYTVPAIDAAGNLYFSVLNSGKLFSVTPAGVLRWIYSDVSTGSSSSPALSPDGATVYFAGYDSKLHAVNAATGARRWAYPLGDEVRASSPAVDANGVVYIGCYDGRLYAINADGTLKRTYDTADWIRSSPLIHGNTLYVGSNDQKLYAFDIGAPAASGPWPQYRHNIRRTGRPVLADALGITVAPVSQNLTVGDALTLSVTATGEPPLTYQWYKDGQSIAGATSPTYTVPAAGTSAAGSYTVVISGPQGTVTSAAAVVTVQPRSEAPVPGRLVNLSVRTGTAGGTQALTVGFVIGGTGNRPLLIRGIGPTLSRFNVPSPVPDSLLELFSGSTLLAANDDWGGAATISAAATVVGAFPLDGDSKDAALLRALAPGLYTVSVLPKANATGIALAELYDTEASTANTSSRLVNVSARAHVGGGNGALIAGFVVSGTTTKRVLIRGIGPALQEFGLTGTLANPKLDVFNDREQRIGGNDDWAGTASLTTAFASVGAFPLRDAGSRDAAAILELSAGSYTVQLSGSDAGTGLGLIEVYELD